MIYGEPANQQLSAVFLCGKKSASRCHCQLCFSFGAVTLANLLLFDLSLLYSPFAMLLWLVDDLLFSYRTPVDSPIFIISVMFSFIGYVLSHLSSRDLVPVPPGSKICYVLSMKMLSPFPCINSYSLSFRFKSSFTACIVLINQFAMEPLPTYSIRYNNPVFLQI